MTKTHTQPKASETAEVSLIQKEIGYAYPTSITANKLGYGSKGCWYVAIVKGLLNYPIEGFQSKENATIYADNVWGNFPYSRWTHK